MQTFSVEDFRDKIDSLYRLVIVASRRAAQVTRPDSRPFVPAGARKATLVALDEVLAGKVTYKTGEEIEEDLVG
jgi:DNA-directed RNA polymerase subunit omega